MAADLSHEDFRGYDAALGHREQVSHYLHFWRMKLTAQAYLPRAVEAVGATDDAYVAADQASQPGHLRLLMIGRQGAAATNI